MSWKDSLRNSLGIGNIYATMTRFDVEKYKYENGRFYCSYGGDDDYIEVSITMDMKVVEVSNPHNYLLLSMNRKTVMEFFKYWKKSYTVVVNGVEI